MVNKDCSFDPLKLHDLTMEIGDGASHAEAHYFTKDQEREVITFMLRKMKEVNSNNGTLQRMADKMKSDGEHQEGLQKFLGAILHRVAKKAGDIRDFEST